MRKVAGDLSRRLFSIRTGPPMDPTKVLAGDGAGSSSSHDYMKNVVNRVINREDTRISYKDLMKRGLKKVLPETEDGAGDGEDSGTGIIGLIAGGFGEDFAVKAVGTGLTAAITTTSCYALKGAKKLAKMNWSGKDPEFPEVKLWDPDHIILQMHMVLVKPENIRAFIDPDNVFHAAGHELDIDNHVVKSYYYRMPLPRDGNFTGPRRAEIASGALTIDFVGFKRKMVEIEVIKRI